MKNQLLTLSFSVFILMFSACGNKVKTQTPEILTERIADLEQMMIDSSQSPARNNITIELAKAYQQYVIENPNAEDAPDKLFKAAQNYGTTGDFLNATDILKSLIETKPKTDYAKDAMFQIAYIYVEMAKYDANQSEVYNNNAKEYYEMLIKDFPNDPLAEQSKLLKSFIGKTDEELLKEVIKKNKK
jgi:TolA-binding protein